MTMDPRKPIDVQGPFYLSDPARTRFVPSAAQPLTLSKQLNAIREELLDELASDEMPEKEKHSSLDHFLGGKYDINEMVKESELGRRTLNNSSDDSSLRNTVKKMSSCYLQKMLEPLDTNQMKAFKLLEIPGDTSIFPSKVKAEVDLLYETNKRPRQQLDKEIRKKKKETRKLERKTRSKTVLTTTTESSQDSCPPLPQEGTSIVKPDPVPVISPVNSVPVSSATPWIPGAKSTSVMSSRKSVILALKGVRGLALAGGCGKASTRGRSGTARTSRGGARGRRGRPRKISGVVVPQFTKEKELQVIQPAVMMNVVNAPETPPPSISPVLPPFPVDSAEDPVSIAKLDGLKMTLKINRRRFSSSPMSEQASPSPSSRPRLVCRLRLPKAKIGELQRKKQATLESEEDDDDDDCLDRY